jgi:hypothetical protein
MKSELGVNEFSQVERVTSRWSSPLGFKTLAA